MRITAGIHRGRVLNVPDLPELRPTPSRVREALFNILGDVEGFTVLDLFAGSGIMAIESLSRGAASAISIEQGGKACEAMKSCRRQIGLDNWNIEKAKLPGALQKYAGERFDLVFADPPYDRGIAGQIPAWLDEFDIDCSRLVIEESSRCLPDWPEGWTVSQSRRYGDTTLHFLEKAEI